MDARAGPWQQSLSSDTYQSQSAQSYQNFGGFPGSPSRSGRPDYQLVPGAEMTQYPGSPLAPGSPVSQGSPSSAPFLGSQGPSQFFPPQPSMPPFGSMQQGMPLAFGSMRYYDQRLEARAPPLPNYATGRGDERQDPRTDDFDNLNGKGSEKPERSQARPSADSAATANILVGTLCGLVAIFVVVLAVLAAWSCYATLMSGKFLTFAALASESSMLQVAMVAFIVLACIALIAAVSLGCLAAASDASKASIFQGFSVVPAVFGSLLLLLALIVWLVAMSARPHAFRSANMICQDSRAWPCSPTVASVTARLLEEAAQPPLESTAVRPDSLLRARREGTARSLGRRLSPADAAWGYVSAFNGSVNAAIGESDLCHAIDELCVPPVGFDASTACACSGFWREPGANAAGSTLGPWNGTEGAYCSNWNSSAVPWCFVSPGQSCSGQTHSVEVGGMTYIMSTAPCSSQVESRSQLVLDGYDELVWSLLPPALLGLVLLLLSCSVFAVARLPAPKPKPAKDTGRTNGANGSLDPAPSTPHWDDKAKSLEARFEQAQKEAVRRLRDDTPQDVKLLLYGFFDQAKYGDCRGERPGFFNTKERSKWEAWAKLRGMSKQEAMEGYIMATALIE